MLSNELLSDLHANEKDAKRKVFNLYFGKLAAIAKRYAKNNEQAEKMTHHCLHECILKLQHKRIVNNQEPDIWFENEFIHHCVNFVKAISSEYYVSSTVHATTNSSSKTYNLFENNELIDFRNLSNDVLIAGLQKMVPSQRLVYNLHVIDSFSIIEVAKLLETSEETVKSNFEKARYNFQKNIEKQLKGIPVV